MADAPADFLLVLGGEGIVGLRVLRRETDFCVRQPLHDLRQPGHAVLARLAQVVHAELCGVLAELLLIFEYWLEINRHL